MWTDDPRGSVLWWGLEWDRAVFCVAGEGAEGRVIIVEGPEVVGRLGGVKK